MVGITGSIIVADTCVDNPDDRILLLLDKFYNSNMDAFARLFLVLYPWLSSIGPALQFRGTGTTRGARIVHCRINAQCRHLNKL
jgi:hypothetical protein